MLGLSLIIEGQVDLATTLEATASAIGPPR
jgi:hypothetical protein